jgi:4-hydroxythreonine-4-phosphate dehydrogenase
MIRPIVAVTTGDPAGIGPETSVESLMQELVYEKSKPLLIGAKPTIEKALKLKKCDFPINVITDPAEGKYEFGTIDLIEPDNYDNDEVLNIEYGVIQKVAGKVSYDIIMKAVELGNAGKIDVCATAPIHKEAIKLNDVAEAGHTEIFENNTDSDFALTMFHTQNLRVFFLTRHVSLRDAVDLVTKEETVKTLKNIDTIFKDLNVDNAKIALAALNPHGSDGGLFGDEEEKELIPAVEEANAQGLNVVGPVPADSVFYQGTQGMYDAILSLYHDQGHIACKTLDFEGTITLTWGLPFLRSGVDHGTAFDIAGKNTANYVSMYNQLIIASDYWRMQNGYQEYKVD